MEREHNSSGAWPIWVAATMNGEGADAPARTDASGLRVRRVARGDLAMVEVVAPRADRLDAGAFERRVTEVFRVALGHVRRGEACHPVRFWNFVPCIRRVAPDGRDWYMVFNAGRHAAFEVAVSGGDDWTTRLCTASAVGHDGDALIVQVLASRHRGRSIENPRQVPAYRYSQKYGPLPPCFARATVLPDALGDTLGHALLIGGTASVLGEASMHVGRLDAQIDETCHNIAALIGAAMGRDANGSLTPAETRDRLARVRQLRVYVVDPRDIDRVADILEQRFPGLERMELIRADICRPDLLVEIEGLTAPAPGTGSVPCKTPASEESATKSGITGNPRKPRASGLSSTVPRVPPILTSSNP